VTLARALRETALLLSKNGIEDSRAEARLLLCHATNLSQVQIYTRPEQSLSQAEKGKLEELLSRRLKREPSAYILNQKEFYGIDFYVDSRVLIPRPETELLVDVALEFASNRCPYLKRHLLAADIGTGSGALAISLALNWPASKIYATDISPSALEVAALNCDRHGVTEQVNLLAGDLLTPLPEPVDLIMANLPYISNSEISDLSPEITGYEPRTALDGGERGLDYIERLIQQAQTNVSAGGCLTMEIGTGQEAEISRMVRRSLEGAIFSFIRDYNGTNRVVKIAL